MVLPLHGAETNRLVPQGAEFLVLVANRVHFSQCYVYFYLFMFILNTCAIVWVRASIPDRPRDLRAGGRAGGLVGGRAGGRARC